MLLHLISGVKSIEFTKNTTCDVLLVGGGGAGGPNKGGGSSGGILFYTNVSFTSNTNYSIVVGAGGTNRRS